MSNARQVAGDSVRLTLWSVTTSTKFNSTDCPYGWSADSHCCPPASETLFQAKIRDPEVEDERQAIDVEGK